MPFGRRLLTDGEIALGRTMFAAEIDWRSIGIAHVKMAPLGAVVPLGRTIIHGARWPPPADFATADLWQQGWFIHELTHVWQAATGLVLAVAKLSALGRRAYAVRLRPGFGFWDYNIEQQAEIARLLFMARSGRPETNSPNRETLEALWPVRREPVGPG